MSLKLNSEKILLSVIAFIASIGTKIAFDANSQLKLLNDTIIRVAISSDINKAAMNELKDKLDYLEKTTVLNHLNNRDKIKENEKTIAVVERWCKKWKSEIDQFSR